MQSAFDLSAVVILGFWLMAPGVLWPQLHRYGLATAGCPLIGAEYFSSALVFSLFDFLARRPQSGAIQCNSSPGVAVRLGRIAPAFVKIAPDGIAPSAWDGEGASL
jgi:hypothetical protein